MAGTDRRTDRRTVASGDTAAARFWDRHAAGYARRPVSDRESYDRKLEMTRSFLRADMEVIEFGCGTGSRAIAHAPHVRRILATDLSAEMIRIAARKAIDAGVDNVVFRQTDLDAFPADAASADAVLALNLLHLLADPRAAVAKVYAILKPGGVFVTSTACLRDIAPWLRPVAALARWVGLLPRLAFFSRAELTAMLRETGFEIAEDWQPGSRKAVFIIARKPA